MDSIQKAFIEEFWNRFKQCIRQDDYIKLVSWIYEQWEGTYAQLPLDAAMGQIWLECPTAVNEFINKSKFSYSVYLITSLRNKIRQLTHIQLVDLSKTIAFQ